VEAREPLRSTLELATAAGAELLAERAHDELVTAGARPRRDPIESRSTLTASELRVARMAAEGMTNREVAQALFLSEKTIEGPPAQRLPQARDRVPLAARARAARRRVTAGLQRDKNPALADDAWRTHLPSIAAPIPEITDAERAVADLLPLNADPERARQVRDRVPLWFHTFALNAEHGIYTPGVARDHRYRIPVLPASFEGLRVLDVGTFDGFYAYLAEHRGASRVVAVDNEQYVGWVKARWGVTLKGGEGFRAIGELIGSRVEYVRGDALALPFAGERFDLIFCFGILHRVESPLGLLRGLAGLLAPGGRVLVETYGTTDDGRVDQRTIEVKRHGEVYPGDDYVYWGFAAGGLAALGRLVGLPEIEVTGSVIVDGHPRLLATLTRPAS
jgi:tRNA (mo5U34)-methyltransferase